MKRSKLMTWGLTLAVLFPGGLAIADSESDAAKTEAKVEKKKADFPVFVPPKRGAPVTRVGGATRSITTTNLPMIEAIVPETLGYTLEAQPTLYWYLSDATDVRVDLTVVRGNDSEPMLEVTLPGPFAPGIQQVDLSDHAISLDKGVIYQWYVALLPNPNQRWQGRIAGGVIERVDAPGTLVSDLAKSSATHKPHVLAAAGIWYDAIDDLSRRIAAKPDGTLVAQRGALFEQVGLTAESAPAIAAQ